MMKKLTIVIVSYNVRHYLEQCIVSVQRAAKDIDHEIYVVDNHSHDDTVASLQKRFPTGVTVIENLHNEGFARANNLAIRQSSSEYVLLLNPDTFLSEDSLSTVLSFMDQHPQAGGVGVRMHNCDGSLARESRRGLPTPWVSMLKMLGFKRRYYMSHLSWDAAGRIDVVSGAFCMLRRTALDQIGLLDEDFFMYGEDIDLSYRLLKGGYENWYVPADILHYKGESTQKTSYRYVHVFYQAMLIFFRKHYSHQTLFVTVPIKLAIYARAFLALVQMQYRRLRSSLGMRKRDTSETNYVFVGSDTMLQQCRELARRRGLKATFIGMQAFVDCQPQYQPATCLVYDTSSFSYQQIISCSYAQQGYRPLIGTYSCQSQTLITPKEIIR